ncbi:MAG TPA: hypothetical protein VE714_09645 [Gemmatimonadales bacterium]|nr:hypothetical protein [Gemmatimonadales bacterium]
MRSRPPAGPPGGHERRSRERIALELAGLALGVLGSTGVQPQPTEGESTRAMDAHQVSNPLTAARAGLQLSMESIGRWVDLAADRRLSLLDDLGQVLEDLDRTSEMLRSMNETVRRGATTARGERGGRFDAVRIVRSCLTLERRLLRDRGIDLEFSTTLESLYLKGDPNALFDLLVSVVRAAAEPSGGAATAVRVVLEQKEKEVELAIHGGRALSDFATVRSMTEDAFSGTVKVESAAESQTAKEGREGEGQGGTRLSITLPLPPQRESDRHKS